MADRDPAPPGGPGLAAIVLVTVVGYIVIARVLGLNAAYAGLLYFWYWAAIEGAKLRALPSSLLGALLGVGTAFLLQSAVRAHQPLGIAAVLLLIVIALTADIMKLVPFAVNACFVLFLTVAAAPLIQGHEDFAAVAECILLAAGYFGAIVLGLNRLQARVGRSGDAE